jgi:cell division protein FtsZ
MSLEDAINSDRAVAFGSGMPAKTEAKTETTADGLAEGNAAAPHENAVEGTGERAAESLADKTADKTADKVLEPVMVSDSAAELATRRPFVPAAPAEMPDAEAVPEAAPAGSKTSLINKISGLWTNKAGEEASQPRVEPAVETAGVSDSAPKAPAAPAAPAAPSILDLPRADAMSRMPEPASTTALDSKADDLEIPAFLRRQAN